MLAFPIVRALDGDRLVGHVTGDTSLIVMGLATYTAPDRVYAPCPEMVEAMALKALYRLALVETQVVFGSAAEVELG